MNDKHKYNIRCLELKKLNIQKKKEELKKVNHETLFKQMYRKPKDVCFNSYANTFSQQMRTPVSTQQMRTPVSTQQMRTPVTTQQMRIQVPPQNYMRTYTHLHPQILLEQMRAAHMRNELYMRKMEHRHNMERQFHFQQIHEMHEMHKMFNSQISKKK